VTSTRTPDFTERSTEGIDARLVEESNGVHVDGEALHTRCQAPDVFKGHAGIETAPVETQTDATDGCQELVATAEATIEALVGVSPHTVDGVCS